GADERGVAAPTASPARHGELGAVTGEVGELLAVGVHHRAVGDRDTQRLARGAVPVRSLSVLAVAGLQTALEVEVEQRVDVRVDDEHDVTAVPAVAAVGSAQRLELLTVDRHTAVPTFTGYDLQVHPVHETCHRSSVTTGRPPGTGGRRTC